MNVVVGRRLLVCAALAVPALACGLFACSSQDSSGAASGTDASVDRTATTDDAGSSADDGATRDSASSSDAGLDAKPGKDANGPGEAGDLCSFNRDCNAALRCECSGSCTCAPGARGTGQNGVDACDSGNQCASSVCLEGPDGGFLCSDECATPAECPPKLPRCEDIAFVGRICVRQP